MDMPKTAVVIEYVKEKPQVLTVARYAQKSKLQNEA